MKLARIDDLSSLIAVIIGEAGDEEFMGKLAVGCVVRNRLYDHRWPSTWKGVIYQKKQFSCMNEIPRNGNIPNYIQKNLFPVTMYNAAWWRECKFAAWGVMFDWVRDITNGANHYLNPALLKKLPVWALGETPVCRIGNHEFFRL